MKFTILIPLILMLSCNTNSTLKQDPPSSDNAVDIEVNFYKDVCDGEGRQLCFLIREKGEEGWQPIFEFIEDFDYEWGYMYQLKIDKKKLDYFTSDGSTHSYKLIEVLEKEFIGKDQVFTLPLDKSILGIEDQKYLLFNEVQILIKDAALEEKFSEILSSVDQISCDFTARKNNTILLTNINK